MESTSKDIVISHGDCFAFSLWSWNGIDYVKRQYCKFSFDRDKVASMLRYNKYSRGCIEIFCVSEEMRLLKISFSKNAMDKYQNKRFLTRNKKPILDFRILRSDRVMVLTEEDLIIMLDSYNGAELFVYSIKDMQHKNIFTFLGD